MEPGSNSESIKQVSGRLTILFDMADKAFENYLNNKFYLHALCIRKCNNAIYEQLFDFAYLLPQNLQKDIVSLLNHYDIWFTQFDDFRKTKSFLLNEQFIFFHLDGCSAFPRDSAKNIYKYCCSIRET